MSPPPTAARRDDVLFCAGLNAVVHTEGVRALPSVGRSLMRSPQRVFDVGAGVCVCIPACVCVRACARGRRSATVGGGSYNIASSL